MDPRLNANLCAHLRPASAGYEECVPVEYEKPHRRVNGTLQLNLTFLETWKFLDTLWVFTHALFRHVDYFRIEKVPGMKKLTAKSHLKPKES